MKCDCVIVHENDRKQGHCPRRASVRGSDGYNYCEIHFALMSGYLKISGVPIKAQEKTK